MKKILAAILIAAMILSLAACGGNSTPSTTKADGTTQAASKDDIKLASIAPITGNLAQHGVSIQNAVNLRLKQYNEAGGYQGRKVVVDFYDDQGTAAEAVNVANKIVDGNYIACVGPYTSACGLAIGSLFGEENITLYAVSASHEDFAKQNDMCTTQCAPQSRSREFECDWLWDEGYRKVAYLYLNDDTGNAAQNWFSKFWTAKGGELVLSESFLADQKDFSAVMTKIVSSGVEVISSYANYASAITIIQQARDLGYKGLIVFGGNAQQQEVIDVCGEAAEGVKFISQFSNDYPTEGVKAFVESYEKEYGRKPTQVDYQAYEATNHILQVLDELGPDDTKAIGEKIHNNPKSHSLYGDYPYVNGVPQFPLPIVQIKDGVYCTYK
ncbi:MAG: ABC transporter substrate-binding protein [Lachnospiraceae bacterium]|nr:ABC transporter substrate-binding protein [Lachnospiraceae bacterium]